MQFLGFILLTISALSYATSTGISESNCNRNSRCTLASECRRSVKNIGEKEQTLASCGFHGLSLLICCPLQDIGTTTQRSTVHTTTTNHNNAVNKSPTTTVRTTIATRPTALPKAPVATPATQKPIIKNTTNETTVIKNVDRVSFPAASTVKPVHTYISNPAPSKQPATETRKPTAPSRPVQPPRAPFETPNIPDETPNSHLQSNQNRGPVVNSNNLYQSANTVGSGEVGHVWPSSQHSSTQGNRQEVTSSNVQDLRRHHNYKLIPKDICGTTADGSNRIINGQNVTLGQFPWMALLGHKTSDAPEDFRTVCGGTLISWKYVLTAAHCLTKSSVRIVRLGEHVISTQPDCDRDGLCADPVQDIEIEKKITHPNYGKPILKNDIGLIRLRRSQPRLFSSYIRPICIPLEPEKPTPRRKLILAGWGTTQRDLKISSDILQMAFVPEISQEECDSAQEDTILKPVVDTQMCAAVTDSFSSACYGDSGGPLMDLRQSLVRSHNEPFIMQLGIVSSGADGCGIHGAPTIFTRLSSFSRWILDELRD